MRTATIVPGPVMAPPVISSIIESISVANGASASTIASVTIPQGVFFFDIMVAGKSATDHQCGVYRLHGGIRNVKALEVKASQVLTAAGAGGDTQTITIGNKVYTTQTTLTNVNGNVLLGANQAATLVNLEAAINLGTGAGTLYAAAMTAHTQVTCTARDATTLTVTAIDYGTLPNAFATTETQTNFSWGNTTLLGGVDATGLVGTQGSVVCEDDSGWACAVVADGPNDAMLVQVTSDPTYATIFSGWVRAYQLW